ncbi:MAG: carboxylate--amine ligase [Acidimicrobiaceae bacterium]|nr:carboxylate--amine ligase [Acidimicrobiaceae bacterium]|tara:strand:- start:300 stop:1154 length:855 start_codon:yes stop_codon:yes gene_type:complete
MSKNYTTWEKELEATGGILIAAFEGWNDAGNASSWALRHLCEDLKAEPFAHIQAEHFYDFSATRPLVHLDEKGRQLDWPANCFSAGDNQNVLLLEGIEPQLQWRTFAEQITSVATSLKVSMVVTLGSLLAEVPHSRPVMVYGFCEDLETNSRLNLQKSTYEGPTGIVGVLNQFVHEANIPAISLWSTIPNYVSGAASPKATLALVNRLHEILPNPTDTTELEIASAAYERQVSELIEGDEDMRAYVTDLEYRYDQGEFKEHDPASGFGDRVERWLHDGANPDEA